MTPRPIGIGLAVVSFGVSGLFGGWDNVGAPETPAAPMNQALDCGPYRVTVTGARFLGELADSSPRPVRLKDKANHWLVIVATIDVIDKEPWPFTSDIVSLKDAAGVTEKRGDAVLVRDVTIVGDLNPGMPESIAYFWEQAAGVEPAQVAVEIPKLIHRTDSLSGRQEWKDDGTCAQVKEIPVIDKRVAS